MSNLTTPSHIGKLMKKHGFSFSKKLGQNFIINPGICPKIAEQGGAASGVGVLEIGPGIGVLTRELALRAQKVVAVEVDCRLPPLLAETLGDLDNVKVVNADVLELDLQRLLAEDFPGMEVVVCANLPYYITSPIVMKLLEDRLPIRSITVMVQKEAAQRICAPMPSRQAGAITAAVAYYSEPKILFEVSPGSFLPAPSVLSAVIRLDIRSAPPVKVSDERALFRVIRAAFSQRRKTVLNCLSAGLGLPKEETRALLAAAEVESSARAEQLALADFAAVANRLAAEK